MKTAILSILFATFPLIPSTETLAADKPSSVKRESFLIQFKGISKSEMETCNRIYTVDEQGYLAMPYLKIKILATGQSSADLAKTITKRYKARKIYPQVSVTISRIQRFPIIRRTKHKDKMTLAGAVALARPSQFFRGVVRVTRGGEIKEYNYNDEKTKKVVILPTDIVELVK